MRTRMYASLLAFATLALMALAGSTLSATTFSGAALSPAALASLADAPTQQRQCTIRVTNNTGHTIEVCATLPDGTRTCITLPPHTSGILVVPCGVRVRITVRVCKTTLAVDAGECATAAEDDPAGAFSTCFTDDGSGVDITGGNETPLPCEVEAVPVN